jgi:hypothetical protein
MKRHKLTAGVLTGGLVTPAAVILAVASAGAGHGNYAAARLLLPYTMLLTRATGDRITLPLIALALAQFPLYGAAIGYAASKGRITCAVVPLLVLHTLCAILCFSGLIPNFS